MKKSNKGITIVELVVSISILSIVVLFLFQLILSLKEVYTSSGVKTEMLNKQAIINREINEDLINNDKLILERPLWVIIGNDDQVTTPHSVEMWKFWTTQWTGRQIIHQHI